VELLSGMDVVVDALDSIGSRLLLCGNARKLGIPMVHAAIAGFRVRRHLFDSRQCFVDSLWQLES